MRSKGYEPMKIYLKDSLRDIEMVCAVILLSFCKRIEKSPSNRFMERNMQSTEITIKKGNNNNMVASYALTNRLL